MRAPRGDIIIIALGGRICLAKGLGARLAAGVRDEEEVVGGVASSAAEAGVGDVAGADVLHGLAAGAAPGV